MASNETKPRNARLLLDVFERTTRALDGGRRPEVPRRSVTFLVDHSVCAPGVFPEDFELTLLALSPADELAAARESKGDVLTMATGMARRSLHAVNGQLIDRGVGMDEWLWENLGSGGRQLATAMFAWIGTPGEDAMGKAQASLRIG